MKKIEKAYDKGVEDGRKQMLDELIKKACLNHGHDIDLFTKKELKTRCNLEIHSDGKHFLTIDGRLMCAFTMPDVESIKINENKATFEFKFLEL